MKKREGIFKSKLWMGFFYAFILISFLILVGSFAYQSYSESITGKQIGGGFDPGRGSGEESGEEPIENGETGIPESELPDEKESEPRDENYVIPRSPFQYVNPPIHISVEGIPASDFGDPVIVRKPEQVGAGVTGTLAEWKFPVEISENTNVGLVTVNLPPGSQYVRVSGATPTDVLIRTINIGGDLLKIRDFSGSLVEVTIKNPNPGRLDINFFLPGPYISEERLTSRGKIVVVNNPFDVSYFDFSVVTRLEFNVINEDSLEVISLRDNSRIGYKVFDTNEDGNFDFLRFKVNMPPKSKASYEIISRKVKELTTERIEDSPVIPTLTFEELSEECKDLACSSFSECSLDYLIAFDEGDITTGIQNAVCISENPNCAPVYNIKQDCSFSVRDIGVSESTNIREEIFLEPAEIGEEGEIKKEVSVFTHDRKEKVATLSITEERVDIVFSQNAEDLRLSPESLCENGILDIENREEMIDCGGNCRKCELIERNYFYFIWWGILSALMLAFIFLEIHAWRKRASAHKKQER